MKRPRATPSAVNAVPPSPALPSRYHDEATVRAQVEAGRREAVGGLWHELGRLQRDFLVREGLKTTDRVLDVGCGSLGAGVQLVDYLEPGRYFGIDLRAEWIEAGYVHGIVPAGLGGKPPRDNLRASDSLEAGFAAPVDVALVQSVFTHLPFNDLRWCLDRLQDVVRAGGRFYVTYFELPSDARFGEPYRHDPGGIVTHPSHDPYHYRQEDVLHAAAATAWTGTIIGDWVRPRARQIAAFVRGG